MRATSHELPGPRLPLFLLSIFDFRFSIFSFLFLSGLRYAFVPMKRFLLAAFSLLLSVAITLASILLLLRATLIIERMQSPFLRGLSVVGAVLLGVALLVGSVYLSTHVAVRLFAKNTTDANP